MRHSNKLVFIIVLILISCAFIYLCFINYSGVVFKEELRLYGTDPYYNVRRIWLTSLHYPRLLEFDSYVNHPTGSYINIPPGFHYLLASICKALLGQDHTLYDAGKLSVVITPFLGLFTIGLAAFVGHRWFGPITGLLSAFFIAINPFMLSNSRVGRVDYHMLEPFFLMLILYLFERAYSTGRTGKALLCSLALTLSYFFVPVANIFPAILLGLVLIKCTADVASRQFDEKMAVASKRVFLWALLFALPLSMTSHFARAGSFAVEPVSLFQPAMLLLVLILNAGFWSATSFANKRGVTLRSFLLPVLGLAAISATVLILPPVKHAFMFLVKGDPIASSIVETQSIFAFGAGSYIERAPLFAVAPALLLWAAYRAKRELDFPSLTIAYWLFATMLLGILQIRLFHLMTPVFSLVLSSVFQRGFELSSKRFRVQTSSGIIAAAPFVLAFAVLIGVNYPAINIYKKTEKTFLTTGLTSLLTVFDSLLWIRDNTPKTSFFANPSKKPEYGVLSSWDFGHYIVFYAERPNIANPIIFGQTHREGIFNTSRFFSAMDEEKAAGLCRNLGIRYILVEEQDMETHLHYLGKLEDEISRFSGAEKDDLVRRYFTAMGSRLFYLNGSAVNVQGADIEALGRFRLVYESKHNSDIKVNLEQELSASKVFEFVEGARIRGRTAPDSMVRASVPVRTNRGREFVYHTVTRSGEEGAYELRVPYSNAGTPYETGAHGPYVIKSGGRTTELNVSEDEVIEGATKETDLI
jgi:dolichyl-diphosphooligosaccharide--protein glycosyltransferase